MNLKLSSRNASDGWKSILACDSRRLGLRASKYGWQLDPCAGRSLVTGIGQTVQAATANALKLALEQVGGNYNIARVEYIQVKQYPWFYLATIAIFAHLMEKSDTLAAPQAC